MYIGIDVGGMSIKAGVVTPQGDIVAKYAVPTPLDSNEKFCEAMLESVLQAIKEAKITKRCWRYVSLRRLSLSLLQLVQMRQQTAVFCRQLRILWKPCQTK